MHFKAWNGKAGHFKNPATSICSVDHLVFMLLYALPSVYVLFVCALFTV